MTNSLNNYREMAIVRAVSNTLTLSAFYQQYSAKLSLEIFISQTRHFRQAVLDDIVIKNDNHAIFNCICYLQNFLYIHGTFLLYPELGGRFQGDFMHWKLMISSCLFILTACEQNNAKLTFAELEAAGFEKYQQQFFQLVGATNAWSGSWANEEVEVYTFDDPDLENSAFYKSIRTNRPDSTWNAKCVHKNVIMLSKGEKACEQLAKL